MRADIEWSGADVAGTGAGDLTGRVVCVRDGCVLVAARGRLLRTTLGSGLLARVAVDPDNGPLAGDRVQVRFWPDGPVTLERVVARPVRSEGLS